MARQQQHYREKVVPELIAKFGYKSPMEVPRITKMRLNMAEADAFVARCRDVHGLKITGLMCIPPAGEEPAMHFALLAKIASRNGLSKLSMGMSGDFETAVRHGATHVRIGSALFGERA